MQVCNNSSNNNPIFCKHFIDLQSHDTILSQKKVFFSKNPIVMVSFIVQIAHEPWHSEDKTHDFVLKQNECSKMLNNKGWIFMFSLSTNKCYNGWKKIIDFLNSSCWNKVINIGIFTSHQSCLFWCLCNPMSHQFRVNLRSNYVEYTNFYIRGKILPLWT
jgi:membrane-bound acyltransferase YfiQ involved in biofilm formation